MPDLRDLARAVDVLVGVDPSDRADAVLYAVSLRPGALPHLHVLVAGPARGLARRIRPPAGLAAVALVTSGWAAPLGEADALDAPVPSLHPARRRVAVTALVGSELGPGLPGTTAWSCLRVAGESPKLVAGGLGVIHEQLIRCWERRRDAPGAALRRDRWE